MYGEEKVTVIKSRREMEFAKHDETIKNMYVVDLSREEVTKDIRQSIVGQ